MPTVIQRSTFILSHICELGFSKHMQLKNNVLLFILIKSYKGQKEEIRLQNNRSLNYGLPKYLT